MSCVQVTIYNAHTRATDKHKVGSFKVQRLLFLPAVYIFVTASNSKSINFILRHRHYQAQCQRLINGVSYRCHHVRLWPRRTYSNYSVFRSMPHVCRASINHSHWGRSRSPKMLSIALVIISLCSTVCMHMFFSSVLNDGNRMKPL